MSTDGRWLRPVGDLTAFGGHFEGCGPGPEAGLADEALEAGDSLSGGGVVGTVEGSGRGPFVVVRIWGVAVEMAGIVNVSRGIDSSGRLARLAWALEVDWLDWLD